MSLMVSETAWRLAGPQCRSWSGPFSPSARPQPGHGLDKAGDLLRREHGRQGVGPARERDLVRRTELQEESMKARPLTDADYDRLAAALNRFQGQRALNLEQLDGFFAALICGPGLVHPSEFLPELWGGDMADEEAFESQRELSEFLDLVLRHLNVIADTLQSGDVYVPLLLEDDDGVAHGNDWAQGFSRGHGFASGGIGPNSQMMRITRD